MNQLQEVALQLAKLNVSIIPAKKDKRPTLSSWEPFQKRIMTSEEITHHFASAAALAIVCGHVSEDLEVIDIDTKYDLTGTLYVRYKELIDQADPDLFYLLTLQKTQSGGCHFIYRCPVIEKNQKLASRPATVEEKKKGEKRKVLIETRGEGGYIIAAPSEGYRIMSLYQYNRINLITPQQRSILLDAARSLSEYVEEAITSHSPKSDSNITWNISPGDDYDENGDVVNLLIRHGWKDVGRKGKAVLLKRPGDTSAFHSATFNHIPNRFWCWSTSTEFDTEKLYKPYAVFAILECKGDYKEAARMLIEKGYGKKGASTEIAPAKGKKPTEQKEEGLETIASPYMRVGTHYYKKISTADLHGNQVERLVRWTKDEIILDHSKKFLYTIPKFDTFIVRPAHVGYQQVIGNCYNLYRQLTHEVYEGQYTHTEMFLRHVFQDKYELFLDYLTILWRYPTQILPIVCLVSEKRQTGKTTVLKWLRALFQGNAVILKNENFQTAFNSHYVGKLLIMIDENYVEIDKKKESERIKSMATADTEFIQFKGKDSEEVDFYGKILMTANNKEFIKIDKEEIRYMVVEVPAFEKNDPHLFKKLIDEVPSFLYLLNERSIQTPNEDRAWFRPDLLTSDTLTEVVNNTKLSHEKLIDEYLEECFETFQNDYLTLTPIDIYEELQDKSRFLDLNKVRQYLKSFGYKAEKPKQYSFYSLNNYRNSSNPNAASYVLTRIGRVYTIIRANHSS